MTDTLLKVKPCPVSDEGIQVASATLVSCVKNARDTATQHYDPKEIFEWIRSGKFRAPVENIRRGFSSTLARHSNDRKAAKEAITELKKRLPGVMWSGSFRSRRANDPERLLQHSGLLCADLDGLGHQLTEVRSKLLTSPYLWGLFISPTGDGLKCVFRVPTDAAKHKNSFHAVEKHVHDLTGIQIDQACSDIARLCFLSYAPDAYLNEGAIELELLEIEKPTLPTAAALCEPEIKACRTIAAELLGEIDWKTETRGLCACPGQHLHTTGDGARDCEVYLDGAPAIHCFHNHCLGIREGVNHELRSRIGKAEHAAKLQNRNRSTATGAPMPASWFDEKFPTLSKRFGDAVSVGMRKGGSLFVQDIGEDFLAATLGTESRPDTPTIFLPTEQKFYTYTPADGIYIHRRDPVLLTELSELLLDCGRDCAAACDTQPLKFRLRDSNKLTGVLKKARGILEVGSDFFSTNLTEFIPCANGMLRLSDKALLPFSPTYQRRNKLGVPFDPAAKCPLFLDTLLRPALDPDEIDLLQRWCGLALIGENIAQRILTLIGTPGGGKGTLIRVIVGIIGPTNVASLRTQHLAERFELGRFLGKTLLYGADVPDNFLNHRGASVLKSLTGYDPVTLEFKSSNESPIITCQFNVIVTCNSRLSVHLEGDTEAWRRRLAIVDYHKQKPKRVIADLDRQILATEDSGVLNWMIEGLDKVRADGWQLHLNPQQQKAVDDLLLESDAHNLFAREALIRAEREQLTVEDCWSGYVNFCTQRGWTSLTKNKFSREIGDVIARTYGLTVRHDLRDGSGKAQRGWRGLQLSDKSSPPFEEESFDDFE